jgi:hypothetical protein
VEFEKAADDGNGRPSLETVLERRVA